MNLNRVRRLHLYLGILFAPTILFFTLSGALQTFGLHEGKKNAAYQPPTWIRTLAEIHKDQRLLEEPGKQSPTPTGAHHAKSSLPLKWFVLLMAVGLALTTSLGLYMSFQYHRDRRVIWGLLILGTFLPTALLFL